MEFILHLWQKTFYFEEKFKILRGRLCWWNTNVFGWVDMKIEEDVKALNLLEDQLCLLIVQVLEEDVCERSMRQYSIWRNLHFKESILK